MRYEPSGWIERKQPWNQEPSKAERSLRNLHRHLGILAWCWLSVLMLFGLAAEALNAAETPFSISNLSLDEAGRAAARVPYASDSYYVLYRANRLSGPWVAVDVETVEQLGNIHEVELVEDLPSDKTGATFFRVVKVALRAPGDVDGDGIDDVYELGRRPRLSPMDAADASLDPDLDGRTTLQEYQGNTDPFVANAPLPPPAPLVNVPAESTMASMVTLSGRGPVGTYIRVEGGASLATNQVSSDGAYSLDVLLRLNRLNRLFVTAVDATGQVSAGQPLEVLQDSQPPVVQIDFPTPSLALNVGKIMVAGRVGDALSGYRGLRVWVHSSPAEGALPSAAAAFPSSGAMLAEVDVGIGPNGTYLRGEVPLVQGVNTLSVIAEDLLGNRTVRRTEVVGQVLTGPRLVLVAGDRQSATALTRVAEPLLVRAETGAGAPVGGALVTFEVKRSNGRLLPENSGLVVSDWTKLASANSAGAMKLTVRTDASGLAKVWWTLGSDAGSFNNRVAVSGSDYANQLFYCATANPSVARQLNVASGNHQTVETGAALMEPLRVWASDGLNPVPGTPVTFRVVSGGGMLFAKGRDGTNTAPEGQKADEMTVATGLTGHASIGFVAGLISGPNQIEAFFPGQVGEPVRFTAYGVSRDLAGAGRFTGLVLDNTSRPIGHAYCELEVARYKAGVFTDAEGRFELGDVPGGMGHLRVYGTTATLLYTNVIPTNSFPALSYSVVTVANAENSLPAPILLPRLNTANGRWYDGTTNLVLRCEGIAGLKMTIQANSMHHPDGTRVTVDRPAWVSLNQVHHDDIPMPMPDGVAPPFAWTLQPGGASFDTDKPVQVEYPNMSGLAPGSIAYFLSFNHDTERFEIVASGHVLEDGSRIVSDEGSGLTIAGWGCNCPPYSVSGSCSSPNPCVPPVPSANGCGAAAMGGGNRFTNCGLLPQGGGLTSYCFTGPCDDHDRCYGTCGANKAQCDLDFLKGMVDICTQVATTSYTLNLCQIRAYAYYQAVSIFGGALAYTPAQAAACICTNGAGGGGGGSGGGSGSGNRAALQDLGNQVSLAELPLPPYVDADGDLLPDDWERENGLDPSDANDTWKDPDQDGLSNFLEFFLMMKPLVADSDGDGESDAVEADKISPPLNRVGRLDSTWRVQVGSQTAVADVLGNFQVSNISVTDVLGQNPGDPPDFLSDDLMRVVAVATVNGKMRYATSAFFRLAQGATVTTPALEISDTPPQFPESLRVLPDTTLITQLGGKTRVRVLATFADGTAGELNSAEVGTTFRVSNAAVAQVDAAGNVTALRSGQMIVTASNQGATGAVAIDIIPNSGTTVVRGAVLQTDGTAAAGVTVSVSGLATLPLSTGADGSFELANVPTGAGALTVIARLRLSDGRYFAVSSEVLPGTDGTTDVGTLNLKKLPAAPRFLAGGMGYSLVTKKDGSLWGWGENGDGQVGDGTGVSKPVPTRIGAANDWVAVASGEKHNLGLKKDGSLWSWGNGFSGRLGHGDQATQWAPKRVGSANDWTQIACGNDFSLALRSSGELWVWGENLVGQLGTGDSNRRLTPTPILPGVSWRSMAGGRSHVLAVRVDGTLWAWGANYQFMLGDGTLVDSLVPKQIGSETDWESVVAAGESSLAVKQDGTLWGWGNNSGGQLGVGDTTTRTLRTQTGADTDWWYVSSSANQTLGVKLDGSLWGWGFNFGGELADVLGTKILLPRRLEGAAPWQGAYAAKSDAHTLAVDRNGALFSWGLNSYGQIGNGWIGDLEPVPKRVLGGGWTAGVAGDFRSGGIGADSVGRSWGQGPVGDGSVDNIIFPFTLNTVSNALSMGVGKHFLVVKTNGTLWGWGENFNGQVGDGTIGNYVMVPKRIGTRTDWRLVSASAIVSYAMAADGSLWSWGNNASGQLGTGGFDPSQVPVRVTGIAGPITTLSPGEGYVIVLRGDGTLWGWGNNEQGQLGTAPPNGRQVPGQIGSDADWAAVSAGPYHVLAAKKNGSLWAWGYNFNYQLGDGTRGGKSSPTVNSHLTQVRAVAAGYQFSLAIRADGTLWGWGQNSYGEVGDGTTLVKTQPVQIGSDQDWVAISAGTYHALARKSDGSLWAWGSNEKGTLGTSRRYRVGGDTDWGSKSP